MYRIIFLCLTILASACGGGNGDSPSTEPGRDSSGDTNSTEPPPAAALPATLEIRFLSDGYAKSRLHIQGNQIWWQHINAEAPGLAGSSTSPTFLNDAIWIPQWPADGKNAFCACESQPTELPTEGFSGDIAIETLLAGEARLLQQPQSSGHMTAIIEIENRSSIPIWKAITIKDLSSASEGDITDITVVDDLLMPVVDEVARAEYEQEAEGQARLDTLLAENVELDIPPDPDQSLSFNSVYRSEWMLFMSAELAPAVCNSPAEIFRACYDVTQSECEIVAENETNRCLNEYSHMIPGILHQPEDGANWGGVVGECMGNAYARVLAEWNDSECGF